MTLDDLEIQVAEIHLPETTRWEVLLCMRGVIGYYSVPLRNQARAERFASFLRGFPDCLGKDSLYDFAETGYDMFVESDRGC